MSGTGTATDAYFPGTALTVRSRLRASPQPLHLLTCGSSWSFPGVLEEKIHPYALWVWCSGWLHKSHGSGCCDHTGPKPLPGYLGYRAWCCCFCPRHGGALSRRICTGPRLDRKIRALLVPADFQLVSLRLQMSPAPRVRRRSSARIRRTDGRSRNEPACRRLSDRIGGIEGRRDHRY